MIIKVLKLLPVSSEFLGSPKRVYQTTSDWVENLSKYLQNKHSKKTLIYKALYPQHRIFRKRPIGLDNNIHWEFRKEYQFDSPKTFFVLIPEGRCYSFSGSVIAPDDSLLADVSVEFIPNLKCHSALNQLKFPPLRKIPGKVAVLTATAGHNYYHFMFDVVPRIHILNCAGVDISEIDYFLVNTFEQSYHKEMLLILGIPERKLLESYRYPHIKAEELFVPSLVGVTGNPPLWACEFLRKAFLNTSNGNRSISSRRIYISRAKASYRQVINEAEVIEFIKKLGFESLILETMTVSEQVRVFSDVEIVVSPHGAGLSNIVFCQRGCKIIELYSPNYVRVFFWTLANQVGLEYYYLIGKGERPPEYLDPDHVREDIMVDLESLSKLLSIANIN
ncbi:glycosyltransferase family 61 protein [Roseofilum capinflatum]|uniref:Glycosyltransferase family 61 protein n=1 Tax=Roseofilum capinflatum BLCC-M114 TaxID=3022440 RepID=A0ABT7B8B6_9CYAN|nr:glycosyltransferase family 61 protein [Roseofilum capinflatum]MDJ1175406.1 glycosyltransferase family 61 protein [Roseofilum capinflatum BLCC-M114]